MSKFQVGDKVKIVRVTNKASGKDRYIGETHIIDKIEDDLEQYWYHLKGETWLRWREKELELVSLEDEAKSLLSSLGYTITSPKPKKTGEVIIYRNANKEIWSATADHWNAWGPKTKNSLTIIARVKWTEGDGL